MAQRDLCFVGDEEATGAGMLAVSEGQVVDTRADKMRLAGSAVGGIAAHAVEAVSVELSWVLVDGGVPHAIS